MITTVATSHDHPPDDHIAVGRMIDGKLAGILMAVLLSTAVIWPQAQAMHLNPNGTGQVLVFPYYTVNANNQTLLSIVNKTDQGKAIKVRFREGRDSRTVFEFNLYMSPYDVWSGTLISLTDTGPNNPANLLTNDNSCTVPEFKTSSVLPQLPDGRRYAPFSNAKFTGASDDAGPNTLDRTREGHIELIEMGGLTNLFRGTLDAITHHSNGMPADCTQVVDAWRPGGDFSAYWLEDPNTDLFPPQGGLSGKVQIVDPQSGTLVSYSAVAIDAFSKVTQHTAPDASEPTLASGRDSPSSTVVTANVWNDGQQFASVYPAARAIDAVSALLAADELMNEFVTDATLQVASEWVVSFPTKYAYVDQAIVGNTAVAPFTQVFPTVVSAGNNGVSEADTLLKVFNGEERSESLPCIDPAGCIVFGPLPFPVSAPPLFWATNVITFNQPNAATAGSVVLGSRLSSDVEPINSGIEAGWARLFLYSETSPPGSLMSAHRMRPDLSGFSWLGLPATGFLITRYNNSQASPGLLSNYAKLSPHRGSNQVDLTPSANQTPD